MKRLSIILAAWACMAATGMAREKSNSALLSVDLDRIESCLQLEAYQKSDVFRVTNFFSKEIDTLLATSDVESTSRLTNPELHANLNLLKVILMPEQYRQYLSILNETVSNRAFDHPACNDIYMAQR